MTNHRGGIRGIIELAVLRTIERVLGDFIPVQNFFDLIVGTRYVAPSSLCHQWCWDTHVMPARAGSSLSASASRTGRYHTA